MTGPLRTGPLRTCVGCRRTAPQAELVRFVAGPDGLAPGAGRPGRGAWLCPAEECLERSVRSGALARALRIDRGSVVERQDALRSALGL